MGRSGTATRKGRLQEEAILDATLRCLGRDGYAATSLGSIAKEAGTHKRMVLYYFGDRGHLLERAVVMLGDRLLGEIEEVIEGLEDPADIVAAGFDRLWTAITGERSLLVAYLGLTAESVTDPALRSATGHINEGFRRIITRLIAEARRGGRRLLMEEDSLVVLIVAGVHGLILEYVQRGETPALGRAITDFKRWIASVSVPPDAGREVAPGRRYSTG
jgi:AcrR family transcriptional regulator